jgi:hypothetical protein
MPELVRTSLMTLFPDWLSATMDLWIFFFACSSSKIQPLYCKQNPLIDHRRRAVAHQSHEVVALGVGEEPLVHEDPAYADAPERN